MAKSATGVKLANGKLLLGLEKINSFPKRDYLPNGLVTWVLGGGDNAKRKKYIINKVAAQCVNTARKIRFLELGKNGAPKWYVSKPNTKATYALVQDYQAMAYKELANYIAMSNLIVVNDFALLEAILATSTGVGSKKKLAEFRGSVYYSAITGGVPSLVVDDVSKAYLPSFAQEATALSPIQVDHTLEYDIAKVIRFANNRQVIPEANFHDNYQLVWDVYPDGRDNYITRMTDEDYANPAIIHRREFLTELEQATLLSLDYETSMGQIACLGVSMIKNHDIGTLRNYTVPLINPTRPAGMHMCASAFIKLNKAIMSHPAPKVFANGSYDSHYAIKYHAPPYNIHLDVIHAWHSINARLKKSLAMVSSCMLDNYHYWKDEIKGGHDEKKSQVKYAVPVTANGLDTYWRYCAQDTYYALLAGLSLLPLLTSQKRIHDNYIKEMAMQYGPIMKASYMGTAVNLSIFDKLIASAEATHKEAADNLVIASNGIVTAQATDRECINWLYGTLGASPGKKRAGKPAYSVDQKQLTLVAEKHPIFGRAIELIRDVRKPAKLLSMYRNMRPSLVANKRYRYKYSIAGTYTGRLSGKASDFWDGTNPQNIPAKMREFIIPDKGKIMLDVDYSQADLYHFAVACGDKSMMNNVFDDRDTHAVHVETILKLPYDEVIAGKKANDPKIVDPIRGVRQIIKKLSHGGNYGMSGPTAYINAGREALDAAAAILGIDTSGFSQPAYHHLINQLLRPYFEEYSGQLEFRKRIVEQCRDNHGLATCFGGLTVYFHEWDKKNKEQELMRALLAFYGQGGTAGMINKAIHDMYYAPYGGTDKSFLETYGIDILLQTHDSITYQFDVERLTDSNIVKKILNHMEIECMFNGVKYVVPCEANLGFNWSKHMPEVYADDDQLAVKALDAYVELQERYS